MYPNALELQKRSWNVCDRRLELIEKRDEMPNHRVNANWSSTAPGERIFNGDDLELSKTAQDVFLSIDMIRSGTKHVIALQPINPIRVFSVSQTTF